MMITVGLVAAAVIVISFIKHDLLFSINTLLLLFWWWLMQKS